MVVAWSISGIAGAPTGTVTVTDSASAATCSAAVGVGSCVIVLPNGGARTLTASYSGDATYAAATDTEPHQVSGLAEVPTLGTLALTAFGLLLAGMAVRRISAA